MLMPRRHLITIALFILTITPITRLGAQEQKYPIKLHRPAEEGEVYSYAAVGRLFEKIDVTVDGETTESQNDAYRCELASSVRVMEVDEHGLPTELTITIYRFQKQGEDDQLALDLLGRGTEVHAKFSAEESEFLVGGKLVSDEVAEALGIVAMKLSSQFGETEDEVMGTAQPQGEGDTWELNRESLAAALAINGFHIAPEKLRSEGRLTSVTRAEGGQAEFLGIDVTVIGEGVSPELPSGYASKSGTLTNMISRRFPTDPDLPCAGEEVSFEIIAEAEGKEAESTVNLKIHLKQSLKARYNRIGT
jgi:hypothetical protein